MRDLTWDLRPGDALAPGRTVVRWIGAGLHNEVFVVRDDADGRVAAAKVLRPGWEDRPQDGRRLRRESEVLQSLRHPAFPRCLDVALDGDRPHLLLELVAGPTLAQAAGPRRHGPVRRLSPDRAARMFGLLADGLAALAAQGLVHRDITPENIIAGPDGRIIDLGRVRPAETATRTGTLHPGNCFRAPEICLPGPERGPIGPAADVFGLGASLFYAVSGRRPFPDRKRDRDRTGRRLPAQLTDPPVACHRRLPGELRELLAAMLDIDATARPTAAEVATHLDGCAGRRRTAWVHSVPPLAPLLSAASTAPL